MQLLLQPTSLKSQTTGLLVGFIGIIGLIGIYIFPEYLNLVPPCLFKLLVGIPCPACGATHCAIYFGHFQFLSAFLANPFFFLFFIGLILLGLNTLLGVFSAKTVTVQFSKNEYNWVRYFLIFSLPLNWIYLVCKYFFTERFY